MFLRIQDPKIPVFSRSGGDVLPGDGCGQKAEQQDGEDDGGGGGGKSSRFKAGFLKGVFFTRT